MILRRHAFLLLAAIVAIVSGCSTVTIRVPVMRPAEINLRGKDELVIGEMRGLNQSVADQVNSLLKTAISNSGRFKLIDRQHLDKTLRELSLSQSDLADTESRKKLGKLMTAAIMLAGNVERSDVQQNIQHSRQTCFRVVNKKRVSYPCEHQTRVVKASVAVAFDVIDIETGENLKPKRVACNKEDSSFAIDQTPPPIDGRAMLDACHSYVVAEFMKAIAPWQDYVNAPFKIDGDVPLLEVGVNYAKNGAWNDAIEKFQAAIEFVEKQPEMDAAVVAYAHWDLGLAYEYTFQFDLAIEQVKKAYDMSLEDDYLREIQNIERLKADQARLKEQIGPAEGEEGTGGES